MSKALLIVFVKNIVLGKVKTRLAKTIGNNGAFNVYKQLFNITQSQTINLDIDRHIYFSDMTIKTAWPNDVKFVQKGENIGIRMENAFKKGFELGYNHIILIGSDLPDISEKIIKQGFKNLRKTDFIFGPAEDGGYYLVGMKTLLSGVFHNKPWSKPNLMQTTHKFIINNNRSIDYLEKMNDIDTIDDLNKSSLHSVYKTN
jgi:rSAM/selenodomain-associated transferase 1